MDAMTAKGETRTRRRTLRSAIGIGAVAGLISGSAVLAQDPGAPRYPPVRPAIPHPVAAAAPQPVVAPTPVTPSPPPPVSLRADQIELLQKTLADSPTHGFEADAFFAPQSAALLRSPWPQTRRQGEGQLVMATLRYAIAVHTGQLPQKDFMYEWGLRPAFYDPTPGFVAAVNQDRLAAWLASLPPPYTGYETLRHSLAVYRALAQAGGWRALDDGPSLKVGMTDPRVVDLRARLAVEDAGVAPSPSPVFDEPLAQAVMRAQKRYGLEPDGVAGKSLVTALNVSVQERVQQILANMERWRWLPQVLPVDRIQVNIAAAVLTVFHNDAPVLSMRSVTGRPGDETPMLQSQIHSIVLNPPWNVPSSIASKELWPKERAHPGYLARNDFRVISDGAGGTRLQQRAGDKAALGHVKFDFESKYGVYLHDTPSHSAFGKYSRMVSHGCVRLEKPVVLADLVMADDPQWTPESIDAAIAGGETQRLSLPKPITVLLFYWTAYAGPDGQTNFRDDPYGWDHVLMQRIAAVTHGGA
jgi:murein L,D-transpeptidase YcbB/YkuD